MKDKAKRFSLSTLVGTGGSWHIEAVFSAMPPWESSLNNTKGKGRIIRREVI
jgi:hypothetical protein